MTYEISQLDIPDRQLLPTGARSRASMSTEIGEAVITHTIFGRAKVRIIREHDHTRTIWLTAIVVVTAVAAVSWLEWVASQRNETLQSAAPVPPLSASVQESVPVTQPENITPPVSPMVVQSKPMTPPPTGIDAPAISQKVAPQPAQDLNAAGSIPAKPVRPKPLIASKPQTAPLATDNTASMTQTDKPLPPGLSPPNQSVAPAAATPRAIQPSAQPATRSPTAAVPLAAPVVKEDDRTQSPAGDRQLSDPVNAQSN